MDLLQPNDSLFSRATEGRSGRWRGRKEWVSKRTRCQDGHHRWLSLVGHIHEKETYWYLGFTKPSQGSKGKWEHQYKQANQTSSLNISKLFDFSVERHHWGCNWRQAWQQSLPVPLWWATHIISALNSHRNCVQIYTLLTVHSFSNSFLSLKPDWDQIFRPTSVCWQDSPNKVQNSCS